MAYRKRQTARNSRSSSRGYTGRRTVKRKSTTRRRSYSARPQTLRIVVEQASSAVPGAQTAAARKAVF